MKSNDIMYMLGNGTLSRDEFEAMYKEACKVVKKFKDISKCKDEFDINNLHDARAIVFAHDYLMPAMLSKAARRTCEVDG